MDCSLPGSSVHGILQARQLAWVAMPFSRGSSQPKDRTHVSCVSWIAGGFFTLNRQRSPLNKLTFSQIPVFLSWKLLMASCTHLCSRIMAPKIWYILYSVLHQWLTEIGILLCPVDKIALLSSGCKSSLWIQLHFSQNNILKLDYLPAWWQDTSKVEWLQPLTF